MTEIAELERRITAALERIATGLEAGPSVRVAPPSGGNVLAEALDAERLANAQLTERVRAIKERQETMLAALDRKLARQSEQLDLQGLDLQRLRATCAALRDHNRALTEAAEAGIVDAHLINKGMRVELEALRAQRLSEAAEMDEILSELRPLVEEAANA